MFAKLTYILVVTLLSCGFGGLTGFLFCKSATLDGPSDGMEPIIWGLIILFSAAVGASIGLLVSAFIAFGK